MGNNASCREYLVLGNPVHQVARVDSRDGHVEVIASPEAVRRLFNVGDLAEGMGCGDKGRAGGAESRL